MRSSVASIGQNLGITFLGFVFALLYGLLVIESACAQPAPPDRDYLYLEDRKKKEGKDHGNASSADLTKKRRDFAAIEKGGKLPFDINAKSITFDSAGNKIIADGGVLITYSSMVLEAVKGVVNLETNEAQVSGDVRLSDMSGDITAESGRINLKDGTGVLENADVHLSAGEFQLSGKEVRKEENETFEVKEGTLTTCQCDEGKDCPPWRIQADRAKIVRDGYGQAWGATFDVLNVPVFYTPYLIFPAKTSRQTGLLPATFGFGRQSGFALRQPFFWAINESADATLTPIIETDVRTGIDTEFRTVFSEKSNLQAGLIYLNESARGGDLLGTNTDDLSDPSLDENRFAGYWKQNWKGALGDIPLQFIAKGKYVSDDLFLREYDAQQIGKYNSRYVTSRAVLRAPISEVFTVDALTEYNQALVTDDDFVFQRLPEIEISGLQVFSPFGENQLGLKLVADSDLAFVNFTRQRSFDGSRAEAYQSLKVPFYFKNYFDGSLEGTVRATSYQLNETRVVPEGASDNSSNVFLPDTSDRLVPGFNAKLGTGVERVYSLEEGNLLKAIGELGTLGREQQLARVKHTIEPGVKFKYVPDVDQSDNPQFDSLDQLAEKRVVTYGVTQRLYGRYEPRSEYATGIEELAPTADDLGSFRSEEPLDGALNFGVADAAGEGFQRLRSGSLRELASFKISQSYDVLEAQQDLPAGQSPYSDLAGDLVLFPNDYLIMRYRADYNVDRSRFSDYTTEAQLEDKRTDRLRSRLRFVDGQFRQLETNLEVRLSQAIRFGYYTRYDDLENQLIEQKVGMRYTSSCNCWVFDIDFSDQINPDETKVSFNVTLFGLGEINQRFFPTVHDKQSQNR